MKYIFFAALLILFNPNLSKAQVASINFDIAKRNVVIYDWTDAQVKFTWSSLPTNNEKVSRYFSVANYLTVEQKNEGNSWTYARMTQEPLPNYWSYEAKFIEVEGKSDKSEVGLLLKTSVENGDEHIIFSINSLNQTYRFWNYNANTGKWKSLNNKLKPDEFNFSSMIKRYAVDTPTINSLRLERNGDAFLIYINNTLIENIKLKDSDLTPSNTYGIGIFGKKIQKYNVEKLKFTTYGIDEPQFITKRVPMVVKEKKEEDNKYTPDQVYKAEEVLINYLNSSDRELNPLLDKILRSGKDAWILYKTRERAHKILFNQINDCETFLKEYGKYTTAKFKEGVETRLAQAKATNYSF
jgi:hypothetical protein